MAEGWGNNVESYGKLENRKQAYLAGNSESAT